MKKRYDHPMPEVDSIIHFLNKFAKTKDEVTFLENKCYFFDKFMTYYEVAYSNIPLKGKYKFADLVRINDSMHGQSSIHVEDHFTTFSCKESGEMKLQRLAETETNVGFNPKFEIDTNFVNSLKKVSQLASDFDSDVMVSSGQVMMNCPQINVRSRTTLEKISHPKFSISGEAAEVALKKLTQTTKGDICQVFFDNEPANAVGFQFKIYPFVIRMAFKCNFEGIPDKSILDKMDTSEGVDDSFWQAVEVAAKITPKDEDKKRYVTVGKGFVKNKHGSTFPYVGEPKIPEPLLFNLDLITKVADIGKNGHFRNGVLWFENKEIGIQCVLAPISEGTI